MKPNQVPTFKHEMIKGKIRIIPLNRAARRQIAASLKKQRRK